MGFMSQEQVNLMGFAQVGKNTKLSDKASYYNCRNIKIGNNVRIDDFCVISAGDGGINIGNHVHIAIYASLIGSGNITASDFSGISSRVSIYSSNDDYSGAFLTGPTVPSEFTNVKHADVFIGRHVIIGAGSVVLPGVVLEDGVAIGALSLVTKRCEAFGIFSGVPAKRIKERKKNLLEMEKSFKMPRTER
ncbi:acetyltransferase [Thauera sp. 27]|uniref:acyltransferase n=1 Tax=Thauera sp. 27 TaxID=305700 RepID=UPI0002CD7B77|nr:acyltransferase [Thauera sp. 27]ENO77391.1 acetyltransferase [Thauera sp. 27]